MNKWNAKGGPDGNRVTCDEGCRRGMYCSAVTSFTDDRNQCGSSGIGMG